MHNPTDAPRAAGGAPRPAVVLAGHLFYTLLNSLLFANTVWLMPLLVRLRFGSADPVWKDWQTTLVTAAIPTFMVLSIFWDELLRHIKFRTYLVILWLVAVLPLGAIGLAQNYPQMLALHVIATIGYGGTTPVNGLLLKHFYSDATRGRVYAVLNIATLGGSVAAVYAVGAWLEADPDAFRIYLPAAAVLQILGLLVLTRLVHRTGADRRPLVQTPSSWGTLLRPILHMGAVLKVDLTFFRYECAFMTYGAAYMLCDALLPVLATARLGMRYEDYAHSTQVVTKAVTLLAVVPTGMWLDRVGPVRTSGAAFAVLALYPILLLLAGGPAGVAVASVVYGLGLAGVQMGWMLGPVTLAGTPDKVPQYVAIHTTLVGVRGIVFQSLGMLLYKLTGTFTWPLLLAAVAFLCGAAQMRRLHGLTRADTPRGNPPPRL